MVSCRLIPFIRSERLYYLLRFSSKELGAHRFAWSDGIFCSADLGVALHVAAGMGRGGLVVKCNIRRLCHHGCPCHLLAVYWGGRKMVRREGSVEIRSSSSLKVSPFGRETLQKRVAFYLGRRA